MFLFHVYYLYVLGFKWINGYYFNVCKCTRVLTIYDENYNVSLPLHNIKTHTYKCILYNSSLYYLYQANDIKTIKLQIILSTPIFVLGISWLQLIWWILNIWSYLFKCTSSWIIASFKIAHIYPMLKLNSIPFNILLLTLHWATLLFHDL